MGFSRLVPSDLSTYQQDQCDSGNDCRLSSRGRYSSSACPSRKSTNSARDLIGLGDPRFWTQVSSKLAQSFSRYLPVSNSLWLKRGTYAAGPHVLQHFMALSKLLSNILSSMRVTGPTTCGATLEAGPVYCMQQVSLQSENSLADTMQAG